MREKTYNAYNKFMILKHGIKEKNISKTCKLFGVSRTTFYNWNRAYQKYGMQGLESKGHKKPNMPNKVDTKIEKKILDYVEKFPKDGPKCIYYELRSQNVFVGVSGIYNVLKRNNLSQRKQRIEYSTNRKIDNKGKSNKNKDKYLNRSSNYVGEYVVQKIDYIGTFEGIGKIYQYSLYDTYSKWGSVKLFNKKNDIDIWYYFELKLAYLMKKLNLKIDNLVTIKNQEFLAKFYKDNKYEIILKDLKIEHYFNEERNNIIEKEIEEFNSYLVKEFYTKIAKSKDISNFTEAENEMHNFLREYNFSKVINQGRNVGKVPAAVIIERAKQNGVDFDTLPLWILTLVSLIKQEES